ncbi:hypothetical protein [Roseibium sp. RKSG952]|uniref:hypothetical protein n=1 Tax=Roseibium sp. RKSG952 TaxID=2529384 RepID=UPI0012BC41E0|nr:hypothetical protein [Roseibium sp. RKSG952]MTH95364.1 hypothetical protein [Roseibium sp. RKSG952]
MRRKVAISPLFSESVLEMVERKAAEVEMIPAETVVNSPKVEIGSISEVRAEARVSQSGHADLTAPRFWRLAYTSPFVAAMILIAGMFGHTFTAIQLGSLVPALLVSCLISLGLHKTPAYEDRLKVAMIAHFFLGITGALQIPLGGAENLGMVLYLGALTSGTLVVVLTVMSVFGDQTANEH